MSAHGLNLLVFRDGRRQVSGAELRLALMTQLEGLSGVSTSDAKIGVLLRAGEVECAVADTTGDGALPFAELTDALAELLLGGQLPGDFQNIKEAAAHAAVPAEITVSAPEGFAYYALHPLAYATALDKLPALPERLVVIGIRSIGATLSAVTAAAAHRYGLDTMRFTVRPGGHPYNRSTNFSPSELQVIQSGISRAARFLIVDEGPGLSGSSFLSVAEALEAAGVAREEIVLLCAHEPNAEALCSANAAQRWPRFRSVAAAGQQFVPGSAGVFVGGGLWRGQMFQDESLWPAVWSNLERAKYLSPAEDGELRLLKFAGLGHYGDRVLEREERVAAVGLAPMPRRETNGFISYAWIEGRPMAAGDLSHAVITRLAEYCTFRADSFRPSGVDLCALQEMAEHNLAELEFDLPVSLKLERPVIADGHMNPHEWIFSSEGKILKTDSGSHGDDHFYPGPTDIAWDLAGVIVEWCMNAEQSAELLDVYCRASGDDPRSRIRDFILAYAVFRCAYCKMAANAMQGTPEQARLEQAAAGYAARLDADSGAPQQRAEESTPATLAS
jgi:hypothetical protein